MDSLVCDSKAKLFFRVKSNFRIVMRGTCGVLTLIILLSKRSFQKALRLIGTEHTAELYLAR